MKHWPRAWKIDLILVQNFRVERPLRPTRVSYRWPGQARP
jgi:hypothetical protein